MGLPEFSPGLSASRFLPQVPEGWVGATLADHSPQWAVLVPGCLPSLLRAASLVHWFGGAVAPLLWEKKSLPASRLPSRAEGHALTAGRSLRAQRVSL